MIKIKDLFFAPFITEAQLLSRVNELGTEINEDYRGKSPVLVAVLNGSFMFMSDICKAIDLPIGITFVKIASYSGTQSTGKVRSLLGLECDLSGKDVIIIEDIVDTGKSMCYLLDQLGRENPRSVEIASLLLKPTALQENLRIRYIGFEIPDLFVVGYGLDYSGQGRNLRSLYQKTEIQSFNHKKN